MTIIGENRTFDGGGAAINYTHSGRTQVNPQVGETYGAFLVRAGYVRPLSNTERTRRQLAKEARQQRVADRLAAQEEARQARKKAHQGRMGVRHSKGS